MVTYEVDIVKYTSKSKATIMQKIKKKMSLGWMLVAKPEFEVGAVILPTDSVLADSIADRYIETTVWYQRVKKVRKR